MTDKTQFLSTEEVVAHLKQTGHTQDQINLLICSLDQDERELDGILPDDMSCSDPFIHDCLMGEFGTSGEQDEWDELLNRDF